MYRIYDRKEQSDFICLYCKCKTTSDSNKSGKFVTSKEHIFPKSMGGYETLLQGDVCHDCNQRLSIVDRAFKRNSIATAHAYQRDPSKRGRKRNKKSTERQKDEKEHITVYDHRSTIDTKIDSDGMLTTFHGFSLSHFDDLFSRTLHKCLANVLCSYYGSIGTNEIFPELINYVNTGNSPEDWSYAVSYTSFFSTFTICPTILSISSSNKFITALSFIDTSGIYYLETLPNSLNKQKIESYSNYIPTQYENPVNKLFKDNGTSIDTIYGCNEFANHDNLGRLNFIWIKK